MSACRAGTKTWWQCGSRTARLAGRANLSTNHVDIHGAANLAAKVDSHRNWHFDGGRRGEFKRQLLSPFRVTHFIPAFYRKNNSKILRRAIEKTDVSSFAWPG